MLDFDLLYKKIFKEEDGLFNPRDSYYTILTGCCVDAEFYRFFCEHFSLYLYKTSYTLIEPSQIKQLDFVYNLQTLNDQFHDVVNRQFVFLLDFTKSSPEAVFDSLFLDEFYKQRNQGDLFNYIVLLPDDKDKAAMVLNNIEQKIDENDILCIYTVSEFVRESSLIENICGSIVYLSSKKRIFELKSQYNKESFGNVIRDFGAGTQEALKNKKSILYIILNAAFYNPKRAYLRSYILEMCNKAKTCDYEIYKRICENVYAEKIGATNNNTLETLLKTTIDRIPRIEKVNSSDRGFSLFSWFSKLYGMSGVDVVKMSFEVTLAMQKNNVSEELVLDTIKAVFEKCKGYHHENMRLSVGDFLTKYLYAIKESVLSARKKLADFLEIVDENSDYDFLVEKYIKEYVMYYNLQRQFDFWNQVEVLVATEVDFFEQQCAEAKKLYEDLSNLRKGLAFERVASLDEKSVLCCTAVEIMNLADKQDFCDEIAKTYRQPAEVYTGSRFYDVDSLCNIDFVPSFYRKSTEEFVTEKGDFNVRLEKKVGRYLYFLKECQ